MSNTLLRTNQTVQPILAEKLANRNVMALPRLEKITVSIGTGRAKDQAKHVEGATEALQVITGQRPIATKARKAIAGFKLRQGDVVGLQVTLRGQRMWDFLNRLIAVALPRIRDFRGLPRHGIDEQGNYSFGIREHTVFPEIEEEKVSTIYGLGIALTTSADTRADGQALLEALGLPFERTNEA